MLHLVCCSQLKHKSVLTSLFIAVVIGLSFGKIFAPYSSFAQSTSSSESSLVNASSECPTGNLLYGLAPIKPTMNVSRSLRMTDGKSLKPGSLWSVDQAAILKTNGKVTYKLKQRASLSAFSLQADNNDDYEIYGSADGKKYTKLWTAGPQKKPGLQFRYVQLKKPTQPVQYLQLKARKGDKSYSISELEAYCQNPPVWPPKPAFVSPTTYSSKTDRKKYIGRGKIAMALFGLFVFFFPRRLRAKQSSTDASTDVSESDALKSSIKVQDSSPDDSLDHANKESLEEDTVQSKPSSKAEVSTNKKKSRKQRKKAKEKAKETVKETAKETAKEQHQHTQTSIESALPSTSASKSTPHPQTNVKESEQKTRSETLYALIQPTLQSPLVSYLIHRIGWVYFFAFGTVIYSTSNSFIQLNESIDTWADNGQFHNQIFDTLFNSPFSHTHWSFFNAFAVILFSLLMGAHLIYTLYNRYSLDRVIGFLHTWGILGIVWTCALYADELLGKTKNWYGEGWEGLVIACGISIWLVNRHWKAAQVAQAISTEQSWSEIKVNQKAGWALVACLSIFAFMGFGSFHGQRLTHFWDSYHYYMGSKYFPETRYHLLYHCTQLAERDDGREKELKEGRPLRNLVQNRLGTSKDVLDDQNPLVKECRANFSEERWNAFKQDARYFRSYMSLAWWKKMFKDHGYNATPVWNMIGSYLTQRGWDQNLLAPHEEFVPLKPGQTSQQRKAANDRFYKVDRKAFLDRLVFLNCIDLVLYILIFAFFLWAFGLEITAFTALFFAVGYPWSFDWTGGSVGRIPWLFTAAAGLCFLRKGYFFLGGFGLGWSLLLRVFPGAVLGGAAVQVIALLAEKRFGKAWPKSHTRFILGGLASLIILVPLSIPISQGTVDQYKGVTSTYKEFLHNSFKHKNTPLTNHMGYPTLLTFHPKKLVKHLYPLETRLKKEGKLAQHVSLWKDARLSLKKQRQWLFILTLLLVFAGFYFLRNRLSLWETTALSTFFIFLIFELTCYYYCFLILLAPLAYQKHKDIFGMLALVIATQVVQIRVGATDQQYLWESLLVGILFFWIFGHHLYQVYQEFKSSPSQGKKVLKGGVS